MKRAIVVAGPESSGTRLVTDLLIAMGCFGDDGHEQRLDVVFSDGDVEIVAGDAEVLVLRRSFPHDGIWYDLCRVGEAFKEAGYRPLIVAVRRNWPCTILSQLEHGHARTPELALSNIRKAEKLIWQQIRSGRLPYYVVDYDFLVSHPRATILWLASVCDLEHIPVLHEQIKFLHNQGRVGHILEMRGNVMKSIK